jgi:phosphohistidine phosphatase
MLDAASKPSRIYLLRHAHSGWAMPGERDFDRRLDDRGREEAERISMTMAVNGYVPERVLCSKAVRCVETWLVVERHIRREPDVIYTEKLYAYGHNVYVDLITEQAGCRSLLLIGHNPMMEDTAHSLICKRLQASGGGLPNGFPTGGLAVVDLPDPLSLAGKGIGQLTAFLDPRDG